MLTEEEINDRIAKFKHDVKEKGPEEIISKYFYNDFNPAALSLELYHKLRLEIKEHFNLESIFNVFLVGSGRLGFSIKPGSEYKHFDDESDLDIVIISKEIFLKYWKFMRDKNQNIESWKEAGTFENYFFNGWMRPDKLPPSNKFKDPLNWFEYFESLSASEQFGHIKIRGGLYYSLDFLECYQKIAIQKLKIKESLDNENDCN